MNRRPLTKKTRELVWNKYDKHCAYCGCDLEYKDMQVDHINAVYVSELNKEAADNSVDNLMPSCRMCNYYKNTYGIEGFRNRLETTLMENVRRPFDYRLGIKYGLIKEYIKPIKFYFEEYITK